MKYLLLLLLSLNLFATVPNIFSGGEIIDAAKINENLDYLKSLSQSYNIPLNFNNFQENSFIKKSELRNKFQKIKNLSDDFVLISDPGQVISANEMNQKFIEMETQIKQLSGISCADILNKRPSLVNHDGVYYIDTDGDGPNLPYPAYCDMTNNGGGWTLIFTGLIEDGADYNHNHSIYTGTDPRDVLLNINGHLINHQYLQQAIREVPFTKLRIINRLMTSVTNSTFADKRNNLTGWNYSDGDGLSTCEIPNSSGWNVDITGDHTRCRGLLACVGNVKYEDYYVQGLSVRADQASSYSCGPGGADSCSHNYMIGSAHHRGINAYRDDNYSHMVWIK